MSIEVRRGGRTSNYWTGAGRSPKITARPTDDAVELTCYIAVTKGESEVSFRVKSESFEALARAMMEASREDAIRAFGGALKEI